MLISCVVRLVPESLVDGRVAGEVQFVATGERRVVRSAEELLAALLAAGEVATPPSP